MPMCWTFLLQLVALATGQSGAHAARHAVEALKKGNVYGEAGTALPTVNVNQGNVTLQSVHQGKV